MVRSLLLAAVLVFATPACEAQASLRQEASSPASHAPGNIDCPQGLEQLLPGIYYYCAGARDLARGHYASGLSLLRVAAAWGSKPAQFTLGVAYFNGDVAAQNRPLGLAWLGLAAERDDPAYQAVFQSAWRRSTPTEQARANGLWKSMLPRYRDAHAGARAQRHYRYLRGQMVTGQAYGGRWCISGLTGNGMARARGAGALDPDSTEVSCAGEASGDLLVRKLDAYAATLFEGMEGRVTVGSLQQVSAPAPVPEQDAKRR